MGRYESYPICNGLHCHEDQLYKDLEPLLLLPCTWIRSCSCQFSKGDDEIRRAQSHLYPLPNLKQLDRLDGQISQSRTTLHEFVCKDVSVRVVDSLEISPHQADEFQSASTVMGTETTSSETRSSTSPHKRNLFKCKEIVCSLMFVYFKLTNRNTATKNETMKELDPRELLESVILPLSKKATVITAVLTMMSLNLIPFRRLSCWTSRGFLHCHSCGSFRNNRLFGSLGICGSGRI